MGRITKLSRWVLLLAACRRARKCKFCRVKPTLESNLIHVSPTFGCHLNRYGCVFFTENLNRKPSMFQLRSWGFPEHSPLNQSIDWRAISCAWIRAENCHERCPIHPMTMTCRQKGGIKNHIQIKDDGISFATIVQNHEGPSNLHRKIYMYPLVN